MIADFVTRRPLVVVLSFVVVAAVMGFHLPSIDISYSVQKLWNYKGNPHVSALKNYVGEFGEHGTNIGAILRTPQTFTRENLAYIQRASDALKRDPIFCRVSSISTEQTPWGKGDVVSTGQLYDAVPETSSELSHLAKVALNSKLLVPRLLSADGKVAVIAAEMCVPFLEAEFDQYEEALDHFQAILARSKPPQKMKIDIGGLPVVDVELRSILQRDQMVFMSAAFALLVTVLFIVFGRWHGILLPFAAVVISLTTTIGAMAWLGWSINLISSVLPTILLVYGLLDSIFVLTLFYSMIDEGHGRREAVRLTIRRILWPCFLTSITTALGFGSFAITEFALLQQFGIALSIGVIIAFLAAVLWLPAILCLVPVPKRGYSNRYVASKVNASLNWISTRSRRFRVIVLLVSLAVFAAAALVSATQSKIEFFYLHELPPEAKCMQANEIIDEKLGGLMENGVVIDGPPGSFKDPKVLAAIARVDSWAEKHDFVRSSDSLADVIRSMNQAFQGGDPRSLVVPTSGPVVAQYMALLNPSTRSNYVREDYSRTHLRIVTSDVGLTKSKRFRADLEQVVHKELGTFKTTITGYAKTGQYGLERVVLEVLWGFVIAFCIIAVLVLVAFRSVRAGLLAAMPNMLPTTVGLALMVLFGITLRTATVLFLGISIGIIYDNTIHLMAYFRDDRQAGHDADASVRQGLLLVGPPAVYSALLIAFGFGIFLLSEFEGLMTLGLCCVAVVSVGLGADILLTPVLLREWGRGLFVRKKGDGKRPR